MNPAFYNFDSKTFEYIGAGLADVSPLEEGVFLIPAASTLKPPPAVTLNEAAVFDVDADDWKVLPDFRDSVVYSTVDGRRVLISEIGPKPSDTTDLPRPSPWHSWRTGAWVLDVVKATAAAWEGIKAERDRRKAGGVKVGDKWFHSDDGSRIQQMGLVMMGAGLPAGLQWKTMDGTFITMTPALAQQVFTGQAASDQTIFAVAEAHRVAMESSADPAAYDYSTGWPKVFGEA